MIPKAAVVLGLLLSIAISTAVSQPVLNVSHVLVTWPRIELNVALECGGAPAYAVNKQDYRLKENGKDIPNFTLWCPDTSIHCAISTALVFDCSGSMDGTGLAGAKQAGHAFVDKMDGVIDEATVIFFNSTVTTYQQMTSIKPMLHSAVDALFASGGTAVWDAAYAGVVELINNGVNQCRGVVLLADGNDNASTIQVSVVIALARRYNIPVYTVLLGSPSSTVEFEQLSLQTGGKYFQTPNAGQLATIFEQIYDLMRAQLINCRIRYESECPDGSARTVELEILNTCGGSDTASAVYTAPVDSSSFANIDISLGKSAGLRNSEVRMPVDLVTPLAGNTLHPFGFRIIYDTTRLELTGAEALAGSLYDGAAFTITRVAGGAIIETAENRAVTGSGNMFDLIFHTNPVDTGCADVRGGASWFTDGCMIPRLNNTTLCIFADMPIVSCGGLAAPTLAWDKGTGKYSPEQFPLTIRLTNNGGVDAQLSHVRIEYVKNDWTLLAPVSDTIFLPTALIGPGLYSDVGWDIAPRPRGNRKNSRLCVIATFANHNEVSCCVDISIPQAYPRLVCDLNVPGIAVDTFAQQYVSMPFIATLSLTNDGGWETDTVWATIDLPADLELAVPDAPSSFTKTTAPVRIAPSSMGQVSWRVQHPPTPTAKRYTITVTAVSSNTDTLRCSEDVLIPAMPEVFPVTIPFNAAHAFCEGGSVVLDAGSGYLWYRWNTGQTVQSITVTTTGAYYCVMMMSDGRLFATDTVAITVYPQPAAPIITRNGDVLSSTPAFRYQWFKDGPAVPGATGQSLQLTAPGSYRVRIESPDSCIAYSEPFEVTVLSAVMPAYVRSFDVWPEPNDGHVRVRLRTDFPVRTSIVVRSILGQELTRYESATSSTEYSQDIDLGTAAAGVYFLHVTSGGATFVRAVVRSGR